MTSSLSCLGAWGNATTVRQAKSYKWQGVWLCQFVPFVSFEWHYKNSCCDSTISGGGAPLARWILRAKQIFIASSRSPLLYFWQEISSSISDTLWKIGASTMINSNLLAVVESTLTDTASGNWQKPLVMFVCNILALLVISRRIWYPHVGPKMPLPFPSLFNNVSVPAFLACMSAGHLLGVFAILTLHIDKYF